MSASPVSWDVAERVARFYSSDRMPLVARAPEIDGAALARLREDFTRYSAQAEELVVADCGLTPRSGPPRGDVVERGEWAARNVASFRRIVGPTLERVQGDRLPGPFVGPAAAAAGAQLGVVLGWMSTRVLGQYDLLLTEDDDTGDVVYYVAANIVALERRHGFDREQFRLWIALHEVTHRCQFTGVPWLRDHYLQLVDEVLAAVNPDPGRLLETIRRAAQSVRHGVNPLEESGLLGLVAPPEQLAAIGKVQALMSLLEGHGNVTMGRAGSGLVPDAARFGRVLQHRRARANLPARLMQQMLGIDAKLKQYELGERFIAEVESRQGREFLARVWHGPEMLPTMTEIRDPQQWVDRVRALASPVG